MRSNLVVLVLVLVIVLGCSPQPPEQPRSSESVAPVETRDTTLTRPSVPGGSSAPGLGTSEPDR
jgi:hypothetical protein